jgi:D-alanine--poly(phosphoribitol) ligase subunit 1
VTRAQTGGRPASDTVHPESDILDRILDHAGTTPDLPAAEDLDRRLDYAALLAETGEVAAGLVGRGVTPGDRVAIHLPNSLDFVVTALAALWIGAVFVPLAVTDPEARLRVIVEDCDPKVIVTSSPHGDSPALVDRRSVTSAALKGADAPPPRVRNPERSVYAIYTSGTTGTPKGVLIGQRAFLAAVTATVDALGLDAGTRTLCVSAFHFDGSFATLFPTLVAGGRVVIARRDALLFARTFFNAVARHGITYTGFSPSYLRLLLADPKVAALAATPLRVVALGGEAASRADIEALRLAAPEIRIFNRYGPTETTIAVTHHEVVAGAPTDPVPIGRPHAGITFILVDEAGAVIEGCDVVGELHIGGTQLMTGYWGAPELTAEVLGDHVVAGVTSYRSGDLVERKASGEFLYVDRADRVIKRSGVRISLVELTEVLRRVSGVSAAATGLFDNDGRLGVAAFVVGDGLTVEAVQRAARRHLPSAMMPDQIIAVPHLPLTPAGKLDGRRLLAAAGLRPVTNGRSLRPRLPAPSAHDGLDAGLGVEDGSQPAPGRREIVGEVADALGQHAEE